MDPPSPLAVETGLSTLEAISALNRNNGLFLYIFKSLLLFTGDDIGDGIFCGFTLAFNLIVGIIGDNLDDNVVDDNSGNNFSEEVLDFIPNGNNIGTNVSLFGIAVCEDLLEAAPKVKY